MSGSKNWITNAPIADVFVVWGKDDEGDIRGYILEKVSIFVMISSLGNQPHQLFFEGYAWVVSSLH